MEPSLDVSRESRPSFFLRHEFAIRRLHSLLGIVPLGLYMVVHLATNASLLDSAATFQSRVIQIHSLGMFLPVVEWGFIFLPLLFHAIIGVWIGWTGKPNSGQYTFTNNKRYTWQRWTGYIAFIYLVMHIFHLHGWFHFHFWLKNIAEPLGMAQFRPYNAASTLALAMDGVFWPAFYLVGMLACVYHLANGLWTAGITWGVWISPAAQRRASRGALMFGLLLGLLGTGAWWASLNTDPVAAKVAEDQMYEEGTKALWIKPDPHKRTASETESEPVMEAAP